MQTRNKLAFFLIVIALGVPIAASLWLHFYDFRKWQYFNKESYAEIKEAGVKNEVNFPVISSFFQAESQRFACFAKYVRNFDDTKIGWVSDIHADRFKKRLVDSGLIRPKQFEQYLPKVFDALAKEGIYTVIATGDNTNSGDINYAKRIEQIAAGKCMNVIWVKGNHDSPQVMSELETPGGAFYYYFDYGGVRIIVLDNTEFEEGKYSYVGKISDEQYDWVASALNTDQKIVVAMHIPIFFNDLVSGKGDRMEMNDTMIRQYERLEKMLSDRKVGLVLSGHYHTQSQKTYNEVDYHVLGALTKDKQEGGYGIIDAQDLSVNYKFAK